MQSGGKRRIRACWPYRCVEGICLDNVPVTVAQPGAQDTSLLGMAFLKRLERLEVTDGRMILHPRRADGEADLAA